MKDWILGIESSCDDTAAALVNVDGHILTSIKVSQDDIHKEYGGVNPEFASRAHVAAILPAIDNMLMEAEVKPESIRAIGVTRGPGLIGPLLVGLNTATGLGMGWGMPVIGINHLRGHLRSADLETSRVKYPATVLLVSGGHSLLAYMPSSAEIRLLGASIDDAIGEAYDKVARMLNLGYPGGPYVDKLAKQGNPVIPFPRPILNEGLNFSLSGLKSAVLRHISGNPNGDLADVASSFVQAVLDVLVVKCSRALSENKSASFVMVGGVAASPQVRTMAGEICQKSNVDLCLPPLKWSTDNAAMIALATWDYLATGNSPPALPEVRLSIVDY